jgi:hypothetical protein
MEYHQISQEKEPHNNKEKAYNNYVSRFRIAKIG